MWHSLSCRNTSSWPVTAHLWLNKWDSGQLTSGLRNRGLRAPEVGISSNAFWINDLLRLSALLLQLRRDVKSRLYAEIKWNTFMVIVCFKISFTSHLLWNVKVHFQLPVRSWQAGMSKNKDLLSIIFNQTVRVSYFLLSRLPGRQIPDRAATAARHSSGVFPRARLELFGETFPPAYHAEIVSNICRCCTGGNPSQVRKMPNNWVFVVRVVLV